MKYFRTIILIFLIFGGLVLIVNQAFLYSDTTTHPYLVEEMAKLYNYYYEPDLTQEQIEQMKKGATDEDKWPRNWFYHFYDPIHENSEVMSAKEWAQNSKKQAGEVGGDHTWQTAISDYNAGYKQKAFYSLGHILHLIEDMAVPAHTRNDAHHMGGDPLENWAGGLPRDSELYNIAEPFIKKGVKPKIFNNLDAYFDEVANFSNRNFFSKNSIKDTIDINTGQVLPKAKYSGPKIVKEAWENGKKYTYGRINGKILRLSRIGKDERGKDLYFLKYKNEDSPEIHADYFSILSKEAVIHGAGVVKLFFESITEPEQEIIEPEKKLSFFQKITSKIEGWALFVKGVVGGAVHVPPSAIKSVIEETAPEPDYMGTMGTFAPKVIDKVLGDTESTEEPVVNEPEITAEESYEVEPPYQEQSSDTGQAHKVEENTFLVQRVIDGDTIVLEDGQTVRYIGIDAPELPNGCFAQEATSKNKELLEGRKVRLEKDISETDSYGRLLRYVYLIEGVQPPAEVELLFVNDYLVRNGYAYDFAYGSDTKYKEQFADAEEEAKENRKGLWGDVCHPLVGEIEEEEENGSKIVQGPKTGGSGGVSPRLIEQAQNQSQGQESSEQQQEGQEEEQDTTPPDVFFSFLSYNYASSSLTIQWSSSELPSVSFDIDYKQDNEDWQILLASTSEIETSLSASVLDITYYFRVKAKDLNQNQSAWQETQIKILSKPVIINEIAWMGTKGSPQDEWIELYNRANYDIDLTGWFLKSDDNSPEIAFVEGDAENKTTVNKIISAKGYYLIERLSENDEPDDATNISADWYGSFSYGLKNSGENLELRDNQGNLIDLVDSPRGSYGGWHAGDNSEKRTMERMNPAALGTKPKNWKTYIGSGSSATDVKGNSIFGTPKAKNSVYKLYTVVDSHIIEDTVWTLENSPYLVYVYGGNSNELLEISKGATLTIEPGVIVKFISPGLKVFGTIKAEGISDKPIVFTDYNDKEYAGGIFGSPASSQAGDWSGIWITESSTDSVFDNVIIRYAGSSTPSVKAAIRVENTSIELRNSIIEHSLSKGVWLINSYDTFIESSTFRNNLKDACPSPCTWNDWSKNISLYIDSSSPQIENSTFQNNITGIYIINNSEPIIENNNFSNNSYPIWVYNSYPQFSGNQIEGNRWSGIILKGMILNQDYTLGGESVFINYDHPYNSIIVSEGYTLTIEPGAIIKSMDSTSGLKIEGTLIAEGTPENPIIFTSFYDDEYGGDTNGDGDWAEYCRTKDPNDNTYFNCPKAGSWGQIVFSPTSINSSLNYVIIRYGGTKWGQSQNHQPDYVLKTESNDVVLANSIIENNTSGFYLKNSNSQIANTIFRDHRYSRPFSYFISTGLYLASSRPTIDISTFLNNSLGIYIDLVSLPTLLNLIFENNSQNIQDMRPPEEEP